jgi:hypothetical protein
VVGWGALPWAGAAACTVYRLGSIYCDSCTLGGSSDCFKRLTVTYVGSWSTLRSFLRRGREEELGERILEDNILELGHLRGLSPVLMLLHRAQDVPNASLDMSRHELAPHGPVGAVVASSNNVNNDGLEGGEEVEQGWGMDAEDVMHRRPHEVAGVFSFDSTGAQHGWVLEANAGHHRLLLAQEEVARGDMGEQEAPTAGLKDEEAVQNERADVVSEAGAAQNSADQIGGDAHLEGRGDVQSVEPAVDDVVRVYQRKVVLEEAA